MASDIVVDRDMALENGNHYFEGVGFENCCDGHAELEVHLPSDMTTDPWRTVNSGPTGGLVAPCEAAPPPPPAPAGTADGFTYELRGDSDESGTESEMDEERSHRDGGSGRSDGGGGDGGKVAPRLTTAAVAQEIVRKDLTGTLRVEDVIVHFKNVHHGKGVKNPNDYVYFFEKQRAWEGPTSAKPAPDNLARIIDSGKYNLPESFCERVMDDIKENPKTLKEDSSFCQVSMISATSLDVDLNLYWDVSGGVEERQERAKFIIRLKNIAEDLGIEFYDGRVRQQR